MLNELKDQIGDYGRDTRLNLESVLTAEGAPGLESRQILSVALSCAFSLGSRPLVQALLTAAQGSLDDATVEAAKAAATIMGMNNIYYRAIHLMEDAELKHLPARLRMNVIGKPGIAKVDFELMCFAVSAIAGCGQCLTAHLRELRKVGVSDEGIQSALRIASVINSTEHALKISQI